MRKARTTLADLPGVSSNLGAALRTLLSSEYEDRPESAAVLVDWLASGVDAARDRRQLIAEGLRTAEKGWVRASEALLAIASIASIASIEAPPPREPPRIKTPGTASGTADGARVANVRVAAVPSRRLGIARSVALAVVLAVVGVGAMAVMGRWPGRKQTSHIRDRNQGSRASAEPRPSASNAAGESSQAEADESPQAPEPTLGESVLARVAGHLIVETVPPGAAVWVDGVIKGKSFADIVVGEGGHRIVLIAPGHRMFRDVVDTSHGTIIRRTLVPVDPPTRGNGFLDVDCRTAGKFPILLDDEETGLLCPAKLVPTKPGKHMVGIFVPQERRTILVEATVEAGAKPSAVKFSD
jgi:hypothetical protein